MNNGIIWLKLKISFGYAILVLLSAFIVYQFRQEQMQRHMLRKKEKELVAIHRLAERIYIDLLDLSTHAEIAVTWDDDDLGEYSRKRHGVCDSLQLLKECVHTPLQKSHIDSLCLLLWNKELLLSKAVHTFKELQDIGDIVQESIPAIVLTARKQAARQKENTASPEAGAGDVPKKKRSFRDIFRRKENKSAYLQQREEAERKRQSLSVPSSTGTTTRMLRSLNERVTREQAERRARLLAQMDSLYAGSMELNGRMNNMISEFERKNNERFTARYRAFVLERDNSYHMVAGLALSVSLLAIMLYTVIHRDLNRRLQYERELEQSDRRNRELLRSRKELMASVAHDLRAPLAAVKGCAELLPSESDVSRRSGYLDNILHSADYMLGLVNTLMEYHRMDEGEVRSNDTLFSLKALFEEIADSHRLIARQKDLAFTVSFSGLDAVVCCDSSHIRQIAGNLLSNALKFTPHGEVRLEAEYLYGELSISVRDTGVGISAEEKERIFGAFERLDNARNIPGFGLGLAITARLVSEMRGRVEVKSAPGEGSRFSVFLPVPPAGQSAPLEEKVFPACELLGGTRVLVMDDDRIQQGITREMLSRSRIHCDCCTDVRELMDCLKSQEYDLLLTDIQMPGADGFSVLELLRGSNIPRAREIPAIAVTAHSDREEEYLSAGFAGCIHKPFSAEGLVTAIMRVIKGNGKEWRPDFSLLLAGEDNRQEMLGLFVSESRKDIERLSAAVKEKDSREIISILHRSLPLWETVRLNYPVADLWVLVKSDAGQWEEEEYVKIEKIIGAVRELISYAELMQKEGKE